MKAVVYHGPHDLRYEEVPDPQIRHSQDIIVRVTAAAICGTDLHILHGTLPGMKPGTILGHEFVGVVEQLGPDVTSLQEGDRVLVPTTIACGWCFFCRRGDFSQCDNATPSKTPGWFGGPEQAGAYPGGQAELVRVPFANTGPLVIPDALADEEAVMLTDVFPAGFMAAELAGIRPGDVVVVFGCGPVGLCAQKSARLLGATRVIAVDGIEERLDLARQENQAETIDFRKTDPVQAIRERTGGLGAESCIDAVGAEAVNREGKHQPIQALLWAVEAVRKAGTIAVVGSYGQEAAHFPLVQAFSKNVTWRQGVCNHRTYIPRLIAYVLSGQVDPAFLLTHVLPLDDVLVGYDLFNRRDQGCIKAVLQTAPEELG
ncbi:MAG: glutathione-dependent formaldehyde dehydrogenase [Chloroflexi bacterium]|nr:glutathione-dependent formaldehyde dehydrogenase [Chloroflexota bacterium]